MTSYFFTLSCFIICCCVAATSIVSRSGSSFTSSGSKHEHMSISNMTCSFFTQPLNHFVPRGRSPSYQQRYCVYDEYAKKSLDDGEEDGSSDDDVDPAAPILFYTGNESPLEQYINQTGLMWELAPQLHARVVFVEHRYEGLSIPQNLSHDCLSYASTMQALADYARILEVKLNKGQTAPVIAFGGSYGGMLSGWFRMKYPHLVEGSIAASAPIGAFPQIANDKIDGSARVLMHGMSMPYPPDASPANKNNNNKRKMTRITATVTATTPESTNTMKQVIRGGASILTHADGHRTIDSRDTTSSDGSDSSSIHGNNKNDDYDNLNHCPNNLIAAWPLIKWLAHQQDQHNDKKAKGVLQSSFSLCEPLPDGKAEESALSLIRWAQSVWFDLAEGSFPYPSSYIPFALLHKKVNLPAWPLQAACWNHSRLHADWGVKIQRPSTSTGDEQRSHSTKRNDGTSSVAGSDNQDVVFDVHYGNSGISLHVDWDEVTLISNDSDKDVTSSGVVGLLSNVRDAVSIWYNITNDVS